MTGQTSPETRVPQRAEGPVAAGRTTPRSVPTRRTGVDTCLMAGALLASPLALIVVAGLPAPGRAAADVVRGLVLLLFWLVGPGAAVVIRLRLTPLTKLAVAPLIGLTLLVALGTVGSWTGFWIPRGSTVVVALAVPGATLLAMARGRVPLPSPRLSRRRRSGVVLALVLLASVGLWIASLPAIASAPPSVLGLLVAGPRTFPAALALMAAVLLLALRGRHLGVAWGAVLGLLLAMRTTASVVASVPIAAWTYKHVGVVEALQQHHHVAGGMDIYMNWPGMFAAGAYFSDASGVPAVDLARWFTPVVDVLLCLGVAALAQALGGRRAGCAAAAALFAVVNWVGQDYFSPQAIGLCLAVGVVLLLVQSSTSRACGLLALWLFAGIVVTHQLTPFWLVALAAALVVLRRTPWWVAGGMALLLGAYVLSRLQVAEAYGLFSGFDPIANAQGNVPAGNALGREVGGFFARTSSLLVWCSTLAVLVRRAARLGWAGTWRTPDVLVPAAIAFSPFLLLGGQNYGGEAILRVTLYSTVGCCAVLGPALARGMRGRAVPALAAAAWAAVVVASTAQSSYALWSVNLLHPEDVAAAQWLVRQHPDAAVVPVTGDWPGRTSVDYERYVQPFAGLEPGLDDIVRAQLSPAQPTDSPTIPLSPQLLADVAQLHPQQPTFVVFTESMRQFDAYYATYTPGSFQRTLSSLGTSPEWVLAWHRGGAWIYRYLGPATAAG